MKKELQNKRAQLAVEMRAIFSKAKAENRGLNADETAGWEARKADIESIDATLKRLDETEKYEASGAAVVDAKLDDINAGPARDGKKESAHDRAFVSYLRRGFSGMQPEEQQLLNGTFLDANGNRINAAQTTTTSGGGYLIPEGFSGQLEVALKLYGGMLRAADTVQTETGNPLPWPTVDDVSNVGEMLAINTAATAQDFTFGQATLGAYKFSSKLVLVPIELLQDSYFDLNTFLSARLGERLGRILNQKLTIGAGTTEPMGVVTGATLGRAGATGQTTSVIYDDLVELYHSVDPVYRMSPKCMWMLADSSVKIIKKLKDSQGRPLWQPGISAGIGTEFQDTILDKPYMVNQDVPAMAASAKSILFGDFSKYKARRVLGFTLLRLTERYAEYGQVGFLAFMRADGLLIDAGTHPIAYYQNSAT